MKRFFIISLALVAVAVGCTKSEVTKAPGHNKEIKFNTYVGKAPMTKAVSGDLQRKLLHSMSTHSCTQK